MKTISIYSVLALLILFIVYSCSKEDTKLETSKEFIIDNSKFGISNNKTNPRQTTDGINNAIIQAKNEGCNIVKLTPGEYLLCGEGATGYEQGNGIFVPNNITIDLTGVKLYLQSGTKNVVHKVFRIDEVENVTIIGGHIIGNKDKYDAINKKVGPMECAIEINCSRNVTVDGVKMENLRGSAMWIGYGFIAPNAKRLNKNIKVFNCEIFHNSMQGISIIHGSDIEIAYNKIYDINGLYPAAGINIEPESDWSGDHPWKSWVENVNIHHNEFKDAYLGLCFVSNYTTDIVAADNTFANCPILIDWDPKRISLIRNTLTGTGNGAYIYASKETEDVYMPLKGPNANVIDTIYAQNCSKQTGYIKETDNSLRCIQLPTQ